jgi:hypothetical protein
MYISLKQVGFRDLGMPSSMTLKHAWRLNGQKQLQGKERQLKEGNNNKTNAASKEVI